MEKILLPQMQTIQGELTLPGSKSISNRVLLLAALAEGTTRIQGLLNSEDTLHMQNALTTLGVTWKALASQEVEVEGCCGQLPNKSAELFLGNAGTAFRPLTAVLALNGGQYQLSGIPRMHERPIKDLVDALRSLGASIDYLEQSGFPPLLIKPAQNTYQNEIFVKGDVSSQFLTALLMALPLLSHSTIVHVTGELISKPYINITLNLMEKFGVKVKHHQWQKFIIPANSRYCSPGKIYVEGDASSASYFLAAGALAGEMTVRGIGKNSVQGDTAFANVLAEMGAEVTYGENFIHVQRHHPLQGLEVDCIAIPDAAMTLATLAPFATGCTLLKNIASWRVKETDRIEAMACELRKLGVVAEDQQDSLKVISTQKIKPQVEIATYNDHRMAMCFSLIAFAVPVTILEPHCVAKTYPEYFNDFLRLAVPVNPTVE